MKKIAGIAAVLFLLVIFLLSASFAADKKASKLYELYNSTSTPENYKQTLKRSIDRKERAEKMRGYAKRAPGKSALARPSGVRVAGVSSVPAAADPGFSLGEVYCYPNPAKRTNPTLVSWAISTAPWNGACRSCSPGRRTILCGMARAGCTLLVR